MGKGGKHHDSLSDVDRRPPLAFLCEGFDRGGV